MKTRIYKATLLTVFLALAATGHAQNAPNTAATVEDLLAKCKKTLLYGDRIEGAKKPGKQAAILTLGMIGGEKAETLLLDYFQNEEESTVQFHIIRALGWIGTERSVPFLEKFLRDMNHSYYVRSATASALERITGKTYPCPKTEDDIQKEKAMRERLMNGLSRETSGRRK